MKKSAPRASRFRSAAPESGRAETRPDLWICRDARQYEANEIADLLTDTFAVSPLARWLSPEEKTRRMIAHIYSKMITEYTYGEGIAEVVYDGQADQVIGVALWCPVLLEKEPVYRPRLAKILAEPELSRLLALDQMLHQFYPPEARKTCIWYLAAHAVRPEQRGKGAGSMLLTPWLERIDSIHAPESSVFVHAPTRKASRFYQRHGFTRLPRCSLVALGAAGGRLKTFPMWREPGDPDPTLCDDHARRG